MLEYIYREKNGNIGRQDRMIKKMKYKMADKVKQRKTKQNRDKIKVVNKVK